MTDHQLGLCWGCLPGIGMMELAEAAADAGFSFITLTAGHYLDEIAAGRTDDQIRSDLGAAGVRVKVIDPLIGVLPGTPRISEVDPAMRRFFSYSEADCIRAATATGAETINLAHFLGVSVPMSELQDAVGGIAARNRAAGFETTLEFIPGTGVPDIATARAIINGIPSAGIMFDSWHFARSDGEIGDLDALPTGSIGGVQISDRIAPPADAPYVPMSGRLCPGEGELPLVEMLGSIGRNSPGVPVGLEVFSDELAALGPKAAARRLAETGLAVLGRTEAAQGQVSGILSRRHRASLPGPGQIGLAVVPAWPYPSPHGR